MPRYEKQGFESKKRVENDKRDRSVPDDENFYIAPSVDLSFNSRESNADNNQYLHPSYDDDEAFDIDNIDSNKYSNIMDYGQDDYNQNAPREPRRKKDKPKGKKKHTGVKVLISLVAVLIVLSIIPYSLVNGVLDKINYADAQPMQIDGLYSEKDVKNVMLLGVDALSEGDHGTSRSDSMMLITLDANHKCIKMTSFMRDSWVYIPKVDKEQRLNAACSYGGYQCVIDTIEYNFGIDIDGYVVADFEMFQTLVDSIGGVEVEVTEKEAKEINNHQDRYGYVTIESGKHNLTGKQALAYCRIRKIDTDFKRTERQRTVIMAIINKMKTIGIGGLYDMVSSAAPYIETTFTKSEIMSLGMSALKCLDGEMVQSQVPYDGTWKDKKIKGNQVISLDVEKNKQMLKDNLYNKTAQEFKADNEKQ